MTLTPNTQITQENAHEVPKGGWLRALETTCTFCESDLLQSEGPGPLGELMVFGMSWMAKRFTYIGPDLGDGWIGAPEGGWTSEPLPGVKVEYRFADDADVLESWFGAKNYVGTTPEKDIIAVRPIDSPALSPPAEDHIGDATEKVDWERVGPKLVEALERALVGIKRTNGPTIGDVDRVERTLAALAAAQPEGK